MSLPPPNYTQMPNAILDNMAKFTPGEILVLFAAIRHTVGWHREEAEMSISWFQAQTGLSKNGVIKARDSLSAQDYLEESAKRGDRGVKLYSVKIGTISVTTIPPDEQVLYHSVDTLKKEKENKDIPGDVAPVSVPEKIPPQPNNQSPVQPEPDTGPVRRRCDNCQGMIAFKDGGVYTCSGCGQVTLTRKEPEPPAPANGKGQTWGDMGIGFIDPQPAPARKEAPKPPTPLFLLADAIAQAQWGKPVNELRECDRKDKAFPVAKNFLKGGCTVEDVALVNEWQAQSGLDGMKNGHPNWMWSHLETARAWKRTQAQRVKPSGKIVV